MGNSDFEIIFEKIKALLQKYEAGYQSLHSSDTEYDLWSKKGLAKGKKAKLYEKFCAGVRIRKQYVALYLMGFYKSDLSKSLQLELKRIFSGKYDFHITKLDEDLEEQIKDAIQANFAYFHSKGLD